MDIINKSNKVFHNLKEELYEHLMLDTDSRYSYTPYLCFETKEAADEFEKNFKERLKDAIDSLSEEEKDKYSSEVKELRDKLLSQYLSWKTYTIRNREGQNDFYFFQGVLEDVFEKDSDNLRVVDIEDAIDYCQEALQEAIADDETEILEEIKEFISDLQKAESKGHNKGLVSYGFLHESWDSNDVDTNRIEEDKLNYYREFGACVKIDESIFEALEEIGG